MPRPTACGAADGPAAADTPPGRCLALAQEYGISARLTFSNSLLREEHLTDPKCNALCAQFAQGSVQNGVIVHSDRLADYLQEHYPELYLVSSTTKVLTEFAQLEAETARPEFRYVVPDFRLNKAFAQLDSLPQPQKDKLEFLCNECCWFGCTDRRRCYENVSRRNLASSARSTAARPPVRRKATAFPKQCGTPALSEWRTSAAPTCHGLFAVQDRGPGLGSALVLEFLLYYLTKPEHQLQVREEIYLDNMLDLF